MRALALAGLAVLFVVANIRADEPAGKSVLSNGSPKSDDQSGPDKGSIGKQYALIRAEFEARQAATREALDKFARDKQAIGLKQIAPDLVDYCRRMVDLAESSPESPAARDALLWVINQPARADFRAYGDQFARAVALLVRHHGDDAEAVRIGLRLDNWVTPRRDALLLGFYASAKGREARRTGAAGAGAVPCPQDQGSCLRAKRHRTAQDAQDERGQGR